MAKGSTRTLSTRQRDVLAGARDGLSNKQIGERLGISDQTTKNHLVAAFDALGVIDRTSAVVKAIKLGLIPLE